MMQMQTRTRRDALGIAALAASMIVIGNEAGAAAPSQTTDAVSVRPTREELARAARLYAGEFGGGVGVR